MPIKVSVLCIVYNQARYIRQCLDSMVNQKTNFEFEIIVHDDNSSDETKQIIEEYKLLFPKIIKIIFEKENQYKQKKDIVKDILLDIALGDYIALCEGDDFWCDEYKLQKQYDALENNKDCYLCVSNTIFLDDKHQKKHKHSFVNNDELWDMNKFLESNFNCFNTSNFFINKSLYHKKYYSVANSLVGDLPIVINSLLYGNVVVLKNYTSYYRLLSQGSFTSNLQNHNEKYLCLYNSFLDFYNKINDISGGIYSKAILKKILYYEFKIEVIKRNKQIFNIEKFQPLINEMNLIKKISLYLKIKHPKIQKFFRNIFARQ